MAIFQPNLSLSFVSAVVLEQNHRGQQGQIFYGPDVLPIIQITVSKK